MDLGAGTEENRQEQTFLHLKLSTSAVEVSLRYGKWGEKLIGKDQLKTSGRLQGSSVGKPQHTHEGLRSDPYHPHKKAAITVPLCNPRARECKQEDMRVCRLVALTKTTHSSSVRALLSKVENDIPRSTAGFHGYPHG